ncbi:MAG: DUF3343 domain-containing protein [Ezakiella sp.]|nr:DUF3343 domain-containing protein [Ezakiella sp.]MDD7472407.1 DUF3343 domain-containing protein [Bacillota bacterium]MDY3923141.1 DUF3343 domain-containing protein [Ezakiella sp.]
MIIITFHQLTDALMFEDAAKKFEKDFRLIPVPRKISSSCGLSGKSSLPIEDIKSILEEKKIDFDGIYLEEGDNYTKL